MKKILKSVVFILCLSFAFVLVACGGESTTSSSTIPQKTKVSAVAATCTTAGNIEYYTDADGVYRLEDDGTYTTITLESTVLPALGHSEAEAVRENNVEPTCLAAGGYDLVVYCDRCGEELSRDHHDVEKLNHQLEYVEAKEANIETLENGNVAYYHCTECDNYFHDEQGLEMYENKNDVIIYPFETLEELLELLPFEDVSYEYDGERHKIEYNGPRPSGVRISCTPNRDYNKVGDYEYQLKVVYQGETAYKYATMHITKIHPHYLGETEYDVYLNDPSTQPHFEFDLEGIEVVKVPLYTEPGDYTYTLTTKETSIISSVEPVEITYHVYTSKTGYVFNGDSFVYEGEEVGIYLTPNDDSLLPDGYSIVYENNRASAQGNYKATATIYDASGEVYETFRAILTVDWPDNEEFEAYVTQIFKDYIEGDQVTLNIFTIDYEAMGLEHGVAEWYSFGGYDDYAYEDYLSDIEEIAAEREIFNVFKENYDLSYGQLVSLRRIDEFLTLYERILKSYEYNFIAITYVDQYGGYAGDLPTSMEAYQLRTRQDIEDYISYYESTYDAFESYYEFIVAKAEKGYGYSRFTLEKYNEYLQGVIDAFNGFDGYYLIRVANEKLDAARIELELTDEEYNDYYERLNHATRVTLKEAHVNLHDKIVNFLATETYFDNPTFTGAYLGATKDGRAYYYTLLQNKLGTFNMSATQYKDSLDAYLDYYYNLYKAHSSNSSIGSDIEDGKIVIFDYGDDILTTFDFLKEFASTIVPDLKTNPTISVTWMDPTVTENSTTMAYYMKSPLDSYDKEYIHLNGRQLDSDDSSNYELISTIAHEGYPGHLYAYVNSKENTSLSNFVKMATYTGHGEGWAKYVENQFAYYIASLHEDDEYYDQYVQFADYTTAWEAFAFLVYARADFGINYEGWDATRTASFAKSYGLSFKDPTDFYNTLNEQPAGYPPYGYGLAVFLDLHNQAKEALGVYYNEVEFNTLLLAHGWCSLDSLREYVAEYIDQYNFLLGK